MLTVSFHSLGTVVASFLKPDSVHVLAPAAQCSVTLPVLGITWGTDVASETLYCT